MKKLAALFVMLAVPAFFGALQAFSQQQTYFAASDVFIDQQDPTSNFNGQGLKIAVINSGPMTWHKNSCIRFNIPPLTGQVIYATLTLTLLSSGGLGNFDLVEVRKLKAAWQETSLNWAAAQGITDTTVITSYVQPAGNLVCDLPPALVEDWSLNPANNFGIILSAESGLIQQCNYYDKESPTMTFAPKLVITLGGAPPPTPTAIYGPASVCEYQFYTYSVPPYMNNVTYNWIVPAGWNIISGQGNDTVEIQAGQVSGQICVTASNAYGTSLPKCMAVQVNFIPSKPDSISGPGVVMPGSTQTYTVFPADTSVDFYAWLVWNGTIVAGDSTSSVQVLCGNQPMYVCAAAVNGCGWSDSTCKYVTINTQVPGHAAPGGLMILPGQAGEHMLQIINQADRPYEVKIMNILGELVVQETTVQAESQNCLALKKTGIYVVKFWNERGNGFRKVFVN